MLPSFRLAAGIMHAPRSSLVTPRNLPSKGEGGSETFKGYCMQQGGFAYLSSLGSTVGLRGAGARPMRQIFDEFEKARCAYVSSFEQVTTVLFP